MHAIVMIPTGVAKIGSRDFHN
jgi:hypothetical protein